ncbi:MAG: gamma-glutamyltransferase, partial [Gluconacetobacter sp.]
MPTLARGLYLMHLRYGSVEFGETLTPALELARGGISVSRALATDLAAVQRPLLADPGARAIFSRGDGKVLAEGDTLGQQRLTGVLEQIMSMGVGDLYNGALARSFVAGSQGAGGGLTVADLRAAVPVETDPLTVRAGQVTVGFLPPPPPGGGGGGGGVGGRAGGGARAPGGAAGG